jgi:glycine/serine hydroxymethyltransferase
MAQLANWIVLALQHHDNPQKRAEIKSEVMAFAKAFPLP